jgi:hypothetical protein
MKLIIHARPADYVDCAGIAKWAMDHRADFESPTIIIQDRTGVYLVKWNYSSITVRKDYR